MVFTLTFVQEGAIPLSVEFFVCVIFGSKIKFKSYREKHIGSYCLLHPKKSELRDESFITS